MQHFLAQGLVLLFGSDRTVFFSQRTEYTDHGSGMTRGLIGKTRIKEQALRQLIDVGQLRGHDRPICCTKWMCKMM